MVLSLRLSQIASWPPFLNTDVILPDIIADVPALQRGLVWKPGQIELMWDSLMRGFPIGSFVVRRRLAPKVQSDRHENSTTTHHLLDGQQRAQAIRLGFEDPFAEGSNTASQILWLDLKPAEFGESRAFLFRLTTVAHPWGYQPNDEARPLQMGLIRDSIKLCGQGSDTEGFDKRPRPTECWPIAAAVPVPFAWLVSLSTAADETVFWNNIRFRAEYLLNKSPHQQWSKKAFDLINGQLDSPALRAIYRGMKRLWYTEVPILELPEDAVAPPTGQESADTDQDNVTNVENLFHRLNRNGTRLDGDDLAYSMIKAHWPGIEKDIRTLAERRRLPEARLVRVAARLPIGEGRSVSPEIISSGHAASALSSIGSPVSIAQIRRLAVPDQGDEDRRDRFERFFRGEEARGLGNLLAKIGRWCGPSASYDLPLVIQTSIARDSPDVYALLLWLADRALPAARLEDDGLGKLVQGLITTLHWFAIDKRKAVSAVALRLKSHGPLIRGNFKGLLADDLDKDGYSFIRLPPSVFRLKEALPLPSGEPDSWGCWTAVKHPGHDLAVREAVERVINNRELLLYAQRAFLQRRFRDYDPADEETWAQHNRPWDFDHILPQAAIHRRNMSNKNVVKEWTLRSVSNLRAWPMEANRSDRNESPKDKITDTEKLSKVKAMADSFLTDTDDEFLGFSRGYEFTQASEGAIDSLEAYVVACRARLIRIYRAWYDVEGLDIGYLVNVDGDAQEI